MALNTKNNVLVVGGSTGIGLETAKLALSHLPGSNVIIASSKKDKLEKAVKEIEASASSDGHIIDYVVADMSNLDTHDDEVEKLLQAATKRFDGKIDHIVWTAGEALNREAMAKPSRANAMAVASTRLWAPATLAHLAKQYMNDTRRSSITISSGVLIYKPRPGMALTLAATAMEPLTKGLAVDLAPIRANLIVLGPFRTPLFDGVTHGNKEVEQHFADGTLVKEIGGADEAAEAYLYSMRCAYVTGSRIDCEGGAFLC